MVLKVLLLGCAVAAVDNVGGKKNEVKAYDFVSCDFVE